MRSAVVSLWQRPVALVLAASLTLAGGCDRAGRTLGLTGQVAAVPPKPIGPERLRVSLPAIGAEATLAPIARSGDTIVWQSLDGITLSFREGVLTGTRGLGDDLMTSDVSNTLDMLSGRLGNGYYPQIRSSLDGEYQTVFHSYQCRRSDRSSAGAGRKIEEVCVSPRRSFTNTYWLDAAGRIIRSRQWVSPAIEFMETERVQR